MPFENVLLNSHLNLPKNEKKVKKNKLKPKCKSIKKSGFHFHNGQLW